jgi:(p)ppGpp synthase/HD superfamily hydrolase
MIGTRFVRAVGLANEWHVGQLRKGTKIPYVSHLLAVAGLVLEAGGDEDMAIGALLHDAIEDGGVPEARIEQEFGPRVAAIVAECSDGTPGMKRDKSSWRPRKEAYLLKLRDTENLDAVRVSCADKLHNARSLLLDLKHRGQDAWEPFNAGPAEQLWYYGALVDVFRARLRERHRHTAELKRTVEEIAALQEQGAPA